jgi:hypothetical protein
MRNRKVENDEQRTTTPPIFGKPTVVKKATDDKKASEIEINEY